ncbi:MAG: 12-oxophytodienoate reductase [Novosphingobium sp.]|nr:12-oxophytodienoate reductase [Novosphingobium sp.]MBO9603571.1 12-oxophytodienoate reductase [Novosphingobium sp.]
MSAAPESSPLFTPYRLKGLALPNRFVMPAMQRGMCAAGSPKPELAAYYRRRAEGGVKLIVGESAAIDHETATRQPTSAWITHATRDAWAHCVDEVGKAGGHMLIQLWHEGAVRKDDGLSISPSGYVQPGKANGRAATLDEIAELIEAYTRSALIAQDAGAAGVEVHAAHGYFLDQFLWAGINHRDDGYGGADIAQRARFPAEIVASIRAACGPDFVISLRFSQWKEVDYAARVAGTPDELAVFAGMMKQAGVDVLHASTRRFWEPEWDGDRRNLAGWTRALGGLPVITVGSVGLDTDVMTTFIEGRDAKPRVAEAVEDLEARIAAHEFDLVAVGRALIGDPDFVKKLEARDYGAIRLFTRADLGALEWDTDVIHEAHA